MYFYLILVTFNLPPQKIVMESRNISKKSRFCELDILKPMENCNYYFQKQ